jgi:hypothetical protein
VEALAEAPAAAVEPAAVAAPAVVAEVAPAPAPAAAVRTMPRTPAEARELLVATLGGLGLDAMAGAVTEVGLAADTLVLEDSANGLRASLAAGAPCVIVPSPVTDGSDFTGATAILKTLAGVDLDQLRKIHATAQVHVQVQVQAQA